MKNKITFALILVVFSVLMASCDKPAPGPDTDDIICDSHVDLNNDDLCDNCGDTIEKVVVESNVFVIATVESITLKDFEVNDYNYASLFIISKDEEGVPVVDSYLDLSKVSTAPGSFEVTCNFEGKSAKVTVVVIETIYELNLSVEELTIHKNFVNEYDFLSLFTAKIDGLVIDITPDMIESNVKAESGSYTYTVSNGNISKTLIINVTDLNKIEIINTYNDVKIHQNELENFDFTTLFAVYVNDIAVEVTLEMLDLSALTDATVGESYEVILTYETEENTESKSITVLIVEPKEFTITAKNLVIYPNAEHIDLCSLFEIKYDNEVIPVTNDMISGNINYTAIGTNEITLTYKGVSEVATVEVRKGVVINPRYSDTITIQKGTNQNSYSFMSDFIVVINGVEMKLISESYLDLSSVDFNSVGTYDVKLTIPYNENKLTLTGVKFTYYEKTIKYVVVENEYEITILNDLVELEEGTVSYDVYKNIKVRINGKNQTLTENPDWVGPISCYVQLISSAIDFNKPGIQKVEIAIYVNGPTEDPVYVSYDVQIKTEIVVEAFDKVVYTGETLYTRDLFKITDGDEVIEVTNDMINGHVNIFKPGVYNVNINYQGISMTSKVVILDRYIIGTYKTAQKSIPTTDVNESDEEVIINGSTLPNLVFNEDGTITIGDKTAKIINAIDESTFIVNIRSYEYTLYYDSGIIILDPENNIRLEFNEDKRPLIYFNSDLWNIVDVLTINEKSEHVLTYRYPSYSIDAFNIKSNLDESSKWYGLKVEMTTKMNSDTIYDVSWGELVFATDFVYEIGKQSSAMLNGIRYAFKVETDKTAKIFIDIDPTKFLNKTFTGTYNNQPASLHIDYTGAYTFKVNSEKVFYISKYDIEQQRIGGIDYVENIVLLYDYDDSDNLYSYKFKLNLDDLTFEVYNKELLFGKFVYNDHMLFFDGYGNGIFKDVIKSYYQYPFTYNQNGKEINIDFIKPKDDFAYGKAMNLYLDDFGNIITIGSCEKAELIGAKFENQFITDGAIIRVNITKIGANSDSVAKKELYNNIEIITKDGIISGDNLKNYVDTKLIRFNTPGFYQFSITITINGTALTSYHALQIMSPIYENNTLIGNYNGIANGSTILSIDKYGIAKLTYTGITYEGMVKIFEDNSFAFNAYNNSGHKILVTGNTIKNGIINIRAVGAVTFNEHLTTGTVNIIGCEGTILRIIEVNNEKSYALSTSISGFGSLVDFEILEGNSIFNTNSIVRLYNENEKIVKIISWGNTTSGLILSDGYRGTFKSDGLEDIFVDGFGKVIMNDVISQYDLNGNVITFESNYATYVLRLDSKSFKYSNVDIKLDNTLVEGLTFSSDYVFYCSDYLYNANTTFQFLNNGVVVIKSSSSEHDSGDEMCSSDVYTPLFANASGINGTYNVKGNKIEIQINGIEFIFKIENVLNVNKLVCISTNLDSNSHGYFAIDTIFELI